MRKFLFLSFIMVSAAFFMECSSQPPKSPRVKAEGKDVEVAYGQPSKRGRVTFGGDLAPYGKVWRTGANDATEITFKKDVTFGGQPVKAGTYSLFTIPAENEWTIILNPELKQWGSYGYDKIKDKDLPHVKVPTEKVSSPIEKLTMRFDEKNSLIIEWDQTRVAVPIS